jgi:CHASE2 domain-containing sensor protein
LDVKRINSWIHYYGPPNWLPSVRYSDALDPARVPDSVFRDKVVFIGAKVITKLQNERNDAYRNPYSFFMAKQNQKPLIYGVEVQATMFLNILRGDWLRQPSFEIASWSVHHLWLRRRLWTDAVAPCDRYCGRARCVTFVVIVSRQLFIQKLIWLPWLIPFVQILFALICSVSLKLNPSLCREPNVRPVARNVSLAQAGEEIRGGQRPQAAQAGAQKQKLTDPLQRYRGLHFKNGRHGF